MEKIKIYAPVDGIVKAIENISDPVFASKSLGDGVYIEPSSDIFYSPVKDGKIELITDTKHAIYFSTNNYNVLMHIGLETVGLSGKPFSLSKKQGEKVSLGDEIVKVDWKTIEKANLEKVTPVVVDLNSVSKYKLTIKNEGKKVKKGELIYEIEIEDAKIVKDKKIQIEKREGKYKTLALQYLTAIGGKNNQSLVHNCMTRLRFKIINKDLVNEKALKEIELTKGINWNGEELQIIIGGEVYKVKDECQKIIENKSTNDEKTKVTKVPRKQKIMGAITAIVFPTIPILIGTGVISGLQAILAISGVISNPAPGQSIIELDLFSALMFIMSKVGIELVGIVFLCSTVKYFNGDPWLAIWLGAALTSRYLFGSGWTLFTVFGNPIVIKTYEGTVLPMICAGLLLVFLNNWIKKWMPTSVDIVFRPALVFLSTFLIMLFTVGPFFRIIEQFIAKFVILLGKIPLGIGMAIFAMIWQPLVLTGTHVAVVTVITLPMNDGDPSAMYACLQIAIMGQIGAVLALSFITKNQKTKQAIFASLPGAMFGVTEPIIYGINLPKIKPFIFGCVGSLVGGFVAGILGVAQYRRTGTGIMSWMGLDIGWGMVFGILAGFVSLFTALILTLMLYQDRKSEYIAFRENNKLLLKTIKLNFDFDDAKLKSLKEQLAKETLVIKAFNKNYKNYENNLIDLQKKQIKKQNIINKFEMKKEKLYNKVLKLEDRDLEKYNYFAEKYNNLKLSETFNELFKEIKELELKLVNCEKEVKEFNMKKYKDISDFIDNLNINKNQILDDYKKNYLNAFNSIDIAYELTEVNNMEWTKKEILNLKTREEIKYVKQNTK
ncbi:glucose PTS transporter subunit IIA [Spiroplasma endosymbiont of Cantharis nigra]|uniref:glucose PTS transporter subunit IIA n=1 Tax=Spiroplasma endosymbiont of Cantharis nigra TaxID=3066278 RepID=UPI0030D0B184